MTLSNPSPSSSFSADSDGLFVMENAGKTINSFSISFNKPVTLNSYNVGFASNLDGNEIITLTAGTQSSVENSPFVLGLRSFANMITVAANQVITVVNSGNDPLDILQWKEITVTEVAQPPATTPEPVSLVALLGVGALGFASRKQK
jgi:hypothetical protein